jgi:hypothetical protein
MVFFSKEIKENNKAMLAKSGSYQAMELQQLLVY